MGLGLFNTPLYLNLKCIIFSIFLIFIYYLPKPQSIYHNIIMIFLLGTSGYIALAWYDVIYDCNDRLKPTLFGWITKSFKPPEYQQQYEKLPLKTKKVIRTFDIFVLIILLITFIYPFLIQNPKFFKY
jgi:hypothetical protein